MKKTLQPAERLIVAADFNPTDEYGLRSVSGPLRTLTEKLKGTGVCIKLNSAHRAIGQEVINMIHDHELKVCDDLKLYDIPNTLSTDGAMLRLVRPDMLTVACVAGLDALKAIKTALPDTEVLGVTALSSHNEEYTRRVFRTNLTVVITEMAALAEEAGLDGVICPASYAERVRWRMKREMSINVTAVRPKWAVVENDDQNPDHILTPAEAVLAGADRIVVGRPVMQHENPFCAVTQILDEIK